MPVIIRSRSNLLNPKPHKPAKSYSENAPRPVIRKITIGPRKSSSAATTEVSTTTIPTISTLKIVDSFTKVDSTVHYTSSKQDISHVMMEDNQRNFSENNSSGTDILKSHENVTSTEKSNEDMAIRTPIVPIINAKEVDGRKVNDSVSDSSYTNYANLRESNAESGKEDTINSTSIKVPQLENNVRVRQRIKLKKQRYL